MGKSQAEVPPKTTNAAVVIKDLVFSWNGGVPLLDIADLSFNRGERVFLHGPSGSGKSTLLGLLGGVLLPGTGRLSVLGEDLAGLSGRARDRFRADHLGIIFQMFNLLPYLSVADNVALSCRFSKVRSRRAEEAGGVGAETDRLLKNLGLPLEAMGRPVTDLSVGQQQRVAVARALIGRPELIIADEPTSALDADHRNVFIDLLSAECAVSGATLVFVSHDLSLAKNFDRIVALTEINQADMKEAV
ncbi:ATP-binding cassette domain-containing protein [Parvibaculaceae bacterium PLY_AMNH_Bact1]|nr:ATP-binding cassette domain-containing protein [Parvibaculaceae bacterium PLY_AMNH_Bact1]